MINKQEFAQGSDSTTKFDHLILGQPSVSVAS